jgi:hypothetical protein|tara:strand:- start:6967 stop:7101 length:135 start_codon:yes stop_codon:yes gene_type:complete
MTTVLIGICLGGDVTPSEAALIKVDGDNKWKTIIQNASLNRDYE